MGEDKKCSFWLLWRDHYDYDEHDSFVVRARSEEEARELVVSFVHSLEEPAWRNEARIKKLTLDWDPEIILGSFNAG